MKILLTTHQFLPDHCSGTEVLTFETAKVLQRLGHEVLVFTGYPARKDLDDNERFDSYWYEGVFVTRFHHGRVPMGGQSNIVEAEYNNQLFASFFRTYLKEQMPDLVHFFHLHRLSASAIEVCHEYDIPMVMTPTDFWLVCPMSQLRLTDNSLCKGPDSSRINCLRHVVALSQPEKTSRRLSKLPDCMLRSMIWGINKGMYASHWFAPLVKALYARPAFLEKQMNRLDRMIVPSLLMQRILLEHGLNEDKVVSCPFGINFVPADKMPPSQVAVPLRIGFVGTLAEHKGAHVLVEAVRQIPRERAIEVLLYGNLESYPSYAERLKAAAGDDPRVKFCGTFPNSEIGRVFANLDVLVVPSVWHENTPLIIYTAQAARCPVIASDHEGISEIVHHGKNGLLFPAGDALVLARLIESLYQDPCILKKLAANSEPPKTIDAYVCDLEQIYQEVLSERCNK
ncbi:MAG: glycosyltransferase family 4 protein [Desulfuromonadales bacterium]|nr:glycosyltransferase family 4 protein [Desulfuromonadales bacterium]